MPVIFIFLQGPMLCLYLCLLQEHPPAAYFTMEKNLCLWYINEIIQDFIYFQPLKTQYAADGSQACENQKIMEDIPKSNIIPINIHYITADFGLAHS